MVFRRGQIRRIRWVINILEGQVGQFLLGCKCPMKRGIVTFPPRGVFPSKCPSVAPTEMCNTPRLQFGLLEDKQCGGCRGSQKIEARTFAADFCTRNFLGRGGVSCYAATPLIVASFPGHSDITRFRPWSQVATGNHLDRA